MFNTFQYSLNHLLLNKWNTDSHAVCNAESTLTSTVQFEVQTAPSLHTHCTSKFNIRWEV